MFRVWMIDWDFRICSCKPFWIERQTRLWIFRSMIEPKMYVRIRDLEAIGLQSMVAVGDLCLFWSEIANCNGDKMNSREAWQRDAWNWHVGDGVIKLPVRDLPLRIYQYALWQAEKMNWKRMNGCGRGEKNCKQLYLSSAENRVHIETKGAFYGETIFCVRYQYVDTRHYIEKRLM